MGSGYFWAEVSTLFVIGPLIAIVIAYRAWRGRLEPCGFRQHRTRCIVSGAAAVALFLIAKWINADISTPLYFVQLASVLLGSILFNACMGYFLSVLLLKWHWHNQTRP